MSEYKKFSIVMPVYNEEKIIESVVIDLKNYLDKNGLIYELIIVNDGSTDDTSKKLKSINDIKLIDHLYNKGYGASIKTGVKHSQYDWIFLFDGDGQHKYEYIKDLLKYADDYDMIVGARNGYQGPWIRQPGKRLLKVIASFLVEFDIPDINSGFRLINKGLFNRFVHLYPNGFSLTTTITMACIKAGYNIKYVPITISKRVGKSTVSIKDAIRAFVLITRITVLFSPMKFFIPLSFLFGILTTASVVYDILLMNISETTVLLFIGTILFFLFGIILDQISAIRRELNNK